MRPTENTDRLISALRQVDRIDLSRLFLSGIDVTLHDYTHEDRDLVSRVTIHAEDAGPLVTAFRRALVSAMERRRQSLAMQLVNIDEALS